MGPHGPRIVLTDSAAAREMTGIRSLRLFINSRCNMKREHCFYWPNLNVSVCETHPPLGNLRRLPEPWAVLIWLLLITSLRRDYSDALIAPRHQGRELA
jgi:hypothetical protein